MLIFFDCKIKLQDKFISHKFIGREEDIQLSNRKIVEESSQENSNQYLNIYLIN